jgi:hypothetical protein
MELFNMRTTETKRFQKLWKCSTWKQQKKMFQSCGNVERGNNRREKGSRATEIFNMERTERKMAQELCKLEIGK